MCLRHKRAPHLSMVSCPLWPIRRVSTLANPTTSATQQRDVPESIDPAAWALPELGGQGLAGRARLDDVAQIPSGWSDPDNRRCAESLDLSTKTARFPHNFWRQTYCVSGGVVERDERPAGAVAHDQLALGTAGTRGAPGWYRAADHAQVPPYKASAGRPDPGGNGACCGRENDRLQAHTPRRALKLGNRRRCLAERRRASEPPTVRELERARLSRALRLAQYRRRRRARTPGHLNLSGRTRPAPLTPARGTAI
jgi:hypothetical protein